MGPSMKYDVTSSDDNIIIVGFSASLSHRLTRSHIPTLTLTLKVHSHACQSFTTVNDILLNPSDFDLFVLRSDPVREFV